MVSATARTRCSSSAVRKNGRRNGQWMRSPKTRRSSAHARVQFIGECGREFDIRAQQPVPDFGGRRWLRLRRLRSRGRTVHAIVAPAIFFRRRADKAGGGANAEHFFPARPGIGRIAAQSAVNHEAGHAIHYMREIKFGDAVALEIGRGIQEVNGVRDAIFDGEFDGVHFVAQRLIDGLRVAHDARAEFGGKIVVLHKIAALFGIVDDGKNIHFAEREAAHVLGEINIFLEGHASGAGAVVGRDQLFAIVDFVDVFPAAAGVRLQKRGAADVIEERVPINRIGEIAQGFGIDVHVGGIGFLRQHHGLRNGDA